MLCSNVPLLNSLSAKEKKKYIVEIVLESKNGRHITKEEGCSQA